MLRKKYPFVALLTDFGERDHYAGTMKGVIAGINPRLQVLDISHGIEPHRVAQGSYMLWASYRFFPLKTVFVCVVDPGVGSGRDILIAQSNSFTFVAPDNGLLDLVVQSEGIARAIVVAGNRDLHNALPTYFPHPISQSFHGRDIFSPLGAHLASGVSPGTFGVDRPLGDPGISLMRPEARKGRERILHIDRFGNIVTNVIASPERVGSAHMKGFLLGKRRILQGTQSFDSAPARTPCFMIGSSGLYEIVMKGESAARLLKVTLDSPLRIIRR